MAGGGWSSLPGDLLKEVSARLSSDADHLRIHQVCPHWRAFTSPPAAVRPWVVASLGVRGGLVPIGVYSLRLLRHGAQRMDVGAPPAGLPYCCGTSWGWLALMDDVRSPTRLVLWEPLSNTEISLPILRPLTRIFLSDDPLTSSDWIVMASQLKRFLGQRMLFWRPGDEAWSMMYERGTFEIHSIAFNEGKAYYIDSNRTIIICDLNTVTASPKCTSIYNVSSAVIKLCKCDTLHGVRGVHLVACNGELLLVVFRMEMHPSLAEVYNPEWMPDMHVDIGERVMDLGDYSLFMGRGDTFALSAKEFPGIKRNCVYFMDWPYNEDYWMNVFHLDSDVLEQIPYSEELKQDASNWRPNSFFYPRKPFLKQQ